MENYTYRNTLISKKQLKQLLAWSFTKYDSMQACSLADELKYLGFKYASQAGISISIEDLKVPFIKQLMLQKANQEILNAEKICLKGKITDVERFQKIIDTWSMTSESLKNEVVSYFKSYDPLNSVYIMAFSGARGNLSQVRQLVGMRGLMSDPSGEIMKLPIKKNFREGLTITDYLMSGYGARKGIVDTALKTANSGYLTRRLIDVAQDIIVREKDCLTTHSFLISTTKNKNYNYEPLIGRLLNKPIYDLETGELIAELNTQITAQLVRTFTKNKINNFYIRSPFTCNLYRSICQKCYGWDLASENLVDIGEAIGIIAGQSIGEPGTQLTMRTFHTGGIFTSEASQQITSPTDGIIKFSKILKTIILRTNRGEDVVITKSSGSLIIIPDSINTEVVHIELLRNTILFVKQNQYVKRNSIIGELTNNEKQIRTEIKPIFTNTSGEIFMPRLKTQVNQINSNKLLWILSGQLYKAPIYSFLNLYPDHKINKNSYIYRTKLINHYSGIIKFVNRKKNLHQRIIKIIDTSNVLSNATILTLSQLIQNKNCIFQFKKQKYLVNLDVQDSSVSLKMSKSQDFGTLITNNFKTLTGGSLYYSNDIQFDSSVLNEKISYKFNNNKERKFENLSNLSASLIWLPQETYTLNCDKSMLLVEHGNFISSNFEIIPGIFSKTSGIVLINYKNNLVHTVSIKCGSVYKGKNFDNFAKKVFFPGELLLNNIKITKPSFCEHFIEKSVDQLLIRPLDIYEIPRLDSIKKIFGSNSQIDSIFNLQNSSKILYLSKQFIRSAKSVNLVSNILNFKSKNILNKRLIEIKFLNNAPKNSLNLEITESLLLNDYISPNLKYTNIDSSLLVEKNQFVDHYTILGYLESVVSNALEVVKFKSKSTDIRQIFLISNKDCLTIEKKYIKNKKVNDLIINDLNATGKILVNNNKRVTIQKGRPYFFPNCKNDKSGNKTQLQYKFFKKDKLPFSNYFNSARSISVNYYDVRNKFFEKEIFSKDSKASDKTYSGRKLQFSKMFIRKNGKLYSSGIPKFFKYFSLTEESEKKNTSSIEINNSLSSNPTTSIVTKEENIETSYFSSPVVSKKKFKSHTTLMIQNSQFISNNYKNIQNSSYRLILVKVLGFPEKKQLKQLLRIHSITEDYFEKELNTVYCKNGEFIEDGETLGLLNFEKEITGDIVQGLPRIEELLEARKNQQKATRIPTNQKKSLLVQKTSIDPNFEFRKLGTTIQENEKINPHNFLKVYFNYYGLIKVLSCDIKQISRFNRLINNYEASYRSFKKVQALILNSVQAVYKSQGVSIADKHLEVVIKQMTTKVLITYEGNTPLLPREVIDLYHIQYINKIVKNHQKSTAFYVPLLLGITKASLNNPSFISAASFQETTRVLTKAAIEGRIDWLRGLKENIIIGHLIPAGTGSANYINCFKKPEYKNNRNNIKTLV